MGLGEYLYKKALREKAGSAEAQDEAQERLNRSSEARDLGRLEGTERLPSFRAGAHEPSRSRVVLQKLQDRFSEIEARNPESAIEYDEDRHSNFSNKHLSSPDPDRRGPARWGGEHAAGRRQLRRINHAYGDTVIRTPEWNIERRSGLPRTVPTRPPRRSNEELMAISEGREEEELSLLDYLLEKYKGMKR